MKKIDNTLQLKEQIYFEIKLILKLMTMRSSLDKLGFTE